jgi:hypothetical protein
MELVVAISSTKGRLLLIASVYPDPIVRILSIKLSIDLYSRQAV